MQRYRLVTHPANRVKQKRDARDVIEVGMGDEYMVDTRKLLDGQVAHTGAGVNQDIVIDQHGCGPQIASDAATATQDLDSHVSPARAEFSLFAGGKIHAAL
jgi:hypothetical protein